MCKRVVPCVNESYWMHMCTWVLALIFFTRHTSIIHSRHTSHFKRHTSHIKRHTSHVTHDTSHITRHIPNSKSIRLIDTPMLNVFIFIWVTESCHPYEWVICVWREAHSRLFLCVNESCYSNEWVICVWHESYWNVWMSGATHGCVTWIILKCVIEWCHSYEWVMFAHIKESCHVSQAVVSHIWIHVCDINHHVCVTHESPH